MALRYLTQLQPQGEQKPSKYDEHFTVFASLDDKIVEKKEYRANVLYDSIVPVVLNNSIKMTKNKIFMFTVVFHTTGFYPLKKHINIPEGKKESVDFDKRKNVSKTFHHDFDFIYSIAHT